MILHTIVPENFKMDGGACFGVVPKSIWSKQIPCDDQNLINLSSRCLLVDFGNRKILFDTGLGNKQSEKFFSHYHLFDRIGIEKALENKGYKAEQITDVVLTHLHFDHVGGAVKWNAQEEKPIVVFSNATYYCTKTQWDHALNSNPREQASYFQENYLSLFHQGRLEFIHENLIFCPGIELEIKNGHTIGQIIPIIEVNNRKVVFTADFIATLFNIPLSYVPSFDIDPVLSMKEKQEFLTRAMKENYILNFEHDYYNECCTLQQTPKGIKHADVFSLDDISAFV
jgi:glyoxylase-like metal-dependent hydrolase (beta-lactamase superfamily II)